MWGWVEAAWNRNRKLFKGTNGSETCTAPSARCTVPSAHQFNPTYCFVKVCEKFILFHFRGSTVKMEISDD